MTLTENDRNFLLEHGTVREYWRGQLLFQQGDDATSVLLVLTGEVEIFVKNRQGRTVIARKGTGELFGEVELVAGQRRTASAVTVTDSRLAIIGKCAFEQCTRTRPELLTAILCQLAITIR